MTFTIAFDSNLYYLTIGDHQPILQIAELTLAVSSGHINDITFH
jgi:hypothetical protein